MRFKELLCKPAKDDETARMLTILSTQLWTPFWLPGLASRPTRRGQDHPGQFIYQQLKEAILVVISDPFKSYSRSKK